MFVFNSIHVDTKPRVLFILFTARAFSELCLERGAESLKLSLLFSEYRSSNLSRREGGAENPLPPICPVPVTLEVN